MIYFLYGVDSYRSKKKLEEIIDGYRKVHKSGLNLIYINADNLGFQELNSRINTISMFAEKKLVIIKDIFENEKFCEEFLENIKKLEEAKDIIVVYHEGEPDKRTKFFKKIEKETKSQEFSSLTPSQLIKWVAEEFAKRNTKISSVAQNVLINYVGNDLWRMSNEIEKLCAYKKIIEKEDVELLVRSNTENEIFKTIDALASKNKKLALDLLHKHLDSGEAPLYLLSMIAYQFRNLLIIKESPYKSGLHPFVVQKSNYLCRQFSFDQLKKIYLKIFQIDLDIKSGKIEPETALDLLISEI
jgi:DNA polymerase-3 subunit delta